MMIVVAAMMDVAMLQLARMRFAYTYHLTGEVQGLASKWMVQIYRHLIARDVCDTSLERITKLVL